MLDFKFDASTLTDELNKKIEKAVDETLLEALDLVEQLLKENILKGSFKPLAASTVCQRLALGFSASPPLIRSRTLLENFAALKTTHRRPGGVEGYVYPNAAATTPYSQTSIGEYMARLNKDRPFLELSSDDRQKVKEFFEKRLAERLGQ